VFIVPGPYYVAPAGTNEVDEYFPKGTDEGQASVVNSDGTISTSFPENIVAIATRDSSSQPKAAASGGAAT
jgi:hypothetical protein